MSTTPDRTMSKELLGEVRALTAEAERIAPRLAELANRYQALDRSIIEWERPLPAETEAQSQRRWEEQGTIRLEDLMQALVSVANVLPHRPEEHEYGYRELERLGALDDDGLDQAQARQILRRWEETAHERAKDASRDSGYALDYIGSDKNDDTVRTGLVYLGAVAGFVHALQIELEGELGWALDIVTKPDPLAYAGG